MSTLISQCLSLCFAICLFCIPLMGTGLKKTHHRQKNAMYTNKNRMYYKIRCSSQKNAMFYKRQSYKEKQGLAWWKLETTTTTTPHHATQTLLPPATTPQPTPRHSTPPHTESTPCLLENSVGSWQLAWNVPATVVPGTAPEKAHIKCCRWV